MDETGTSAASSPQALPSCLNHKPNHMRITKEVKAIADAHIQAKQTGSFDDPSVQTKQQVIEQLLNGKTFSSVLHQVEMRFCTITSLIIAGSLNHIPDSYRAQVYKGFKALLQP